MLVLLINEDRTRLVEVTNEEAAFLKEAEFKLGGHLCGIRDPELRKKALEIADNAKTVDIMQIYYYL